MFFFFFNFTLFFSNYFRYIKRNRRPLNEVVDENKVFFTSKFHKGLLFSKQLYLASKFTIFFKDKFSYT